MVDEISVETIKAQLADNIYERWKARVYDIEGWWSEPLIDELSIQILEYELNNCK